MLLQFVFVATIYYGEYGSSVAAAATAPQQTTAHCTCDYGVAAIAHAFTIKNHHSTSPFNHLSVLVCTAIKTCFSPSPFLPSASAASVPLPPPLAASETSSPGQIDVCKHMTIGRINQVSIFWLKRPVVETFHVSRHVRLPPPTGR